MASDSTEPNECAAIFVVRDITVLDLDGNRLVFGSPEPRAGERRA